MASRRTSTTTRTPAAAAATGRSTTGDNGGGRANPAKKLAAVPAATPAAEEKIPAVITVAEVHIPYFRASVELADGTKLTCQHKYAHESQKSAAACGRQMERSGVAAKSSGGSAAL